MAPHPIAKRRLGVAHVALLLPWILAVVAARLPIRDNSFLWHVTAGRLQIDAREVLTNDPFSFTFAGDPWRTQSWLIELFYGWADQIWGLAFVAPFLATVSLGVFALLMSLVYRRTRSVEATAIAGVLTAWIGAVFLSPRPVLLSYLGLVLVVAATHDRRLRWTLVPITWVWAAVHGSFVLGVAFVVLMGIRNRTRSSIGDVTAMLVAASLTAHGLGVWQVLWEFLANRGALDLITEWATPDFTHPALIPFLFGVLLLIAGANRPGFEKKDLWVVAPFLAFGITATRAVFPAWIVLILFAASALKVVPATSRSRGAGLTGLAIAGAALLVVPYVIPVGDELLDDSFPIDAISALDSEAVFHDDSAGGYLIYALGPARPVFIDDRAELYGAEHMRSMIGARAGQPVWREVFARWGIEQALVRRSDGLAVVLGSEGWNETYSDEEFLVLSRPSLFEG